MNHRIMRLTSRFLIVGLLGLGMPFSPAQAGLIGTDQVATSSPSQAKHDRERISAFLDRADVRAQLQRQGLDAEAAKSRVNALTDEEVKRISGKLDQAPAGGDVIGVLFAIFIILLVTDILGFTKVYSFTRPIK